MDDYEAKGAASPEEKGAFQKLYTAAANKGLNVGNVRAYVFGPDGEPLLIGGGEPKQEAKTLGDLVKKLGTSTGKPVVAPRSQFAPPQAEPGALTLQLTARNLPITEGGWGWGALPGEDWIVYSRKEWATFLPPEGAAPGARWEVERDVALKLLRHFYPAIEEYGFVLKGQYDQVSMRATLVSKSRVRLDVALKMKQCFYSDKVWTGVEATAVGVVDIDPAKKSIQRFLMATEKANSGGNVFGVAVRSLKE